MVFTIEKDDIEELDAALFEAENRKSIDISGFSDENKAFMWSFARKLDSLDHKKLKQFLDE